MSMKEMLELKAYAAAKEDRLASIYRRCEKLAKMNQDATSMDTLQNIKEELDDLKKEASILIRWLADYKKKHKAFFAAPCME